MSRSVYDPPPHYATCRYCGRQYDDSGYYGTDDDAHYCEAKARAALRRILARFPDVEGLVRSVREEIAAELRAAEELRARRELEHLEASLRAKRGEVADLERRLTEKKAGQLTDQREPDHG